MKVNKIFKRTEIYIVFAIILLSFLVEIRSSQFFTGNNIVDLARALTIPAMFCIGELMVLISGGTDVSFPAIASVSMYIVSFYMIDFKGNLIVFILVGTLIGLFLGSLNGILIAHFRFPTMIVTLGTTSLFTGILQGAFGAHESPIPEPMYELGKAKLFSAYNKELGISSDMPTTFIFLIIIIIIAWFILNKTMLGRGIYAIGGDVVAAQRAGFNVFGTQMFIYCFSGALAGFAGVLRASMMLTCHPTNLNGMEMTVIAACVLGGTAVAGGKGTITGALLGIGLMTLMSNSLILIGIPTYWQKVFTGAIILIGTGASAYQFLKNKNMLTAKNA